MNNYDYNKLAPFKWFVLQNFPFIEADFDAITNYQLFCKLGEEINKVINSVNITGEQVENLTIAFNDLKNYVDEYFDDLNIQDEVNNKLDEMAESGELTELITSYLELKCIYGFNTIEDMKEATNLVDGSFCRTFGKDVINDGYGQFYKVRPITSGDVVDNYNIVALDVSETLIAERINQIIIPKVLESFYYYVDGTNGDDENDGLTEQTPFKTLEKALEFLNNGFTDVRIHILTSGNYTIPSNINVFTNVSLHINSDLEGINRPIIIFEREDRSIAFYQSHVNFQNVILAQNNPNTNSRLYFECCSIGMTNVTSNIDKLGLQGTSLEITNLECNILQLRHANGYINGLKITNTDSTRTGIEILWCSGLRLYGDLNIANLNSASITENQSLLLISYSSVSLMFNYTGTIANKYYNGLIVYNSDIWITKNRYTGLTPSGNRYCLNEPILVNANIYQHNNTDTGWLALNIITGTAETGHYAPMYRIKNGVLYLTGVITGVTQGDIIATLPSDVIIENNRYTFITALNSIAETNLIRVLENNNISAFRTYGENATVSLTGIIIPLDL